jgi:hypothetical protein
MPEGSGPLRPLVVAREGARGDQRAAMLPPPVLPGTTRLLAIGQRQTQAEGVGLSFYRGVLNGLLLCTPFWVGLVGLIVRW